MKLRSRKKLSQVDIVSFFAPKATCEDNFEEFASPSSSQENSKVKTYSKRANSNRSNDVPPPSSFKPNMEDLSLNIDGILHGIKRKKRKLDESQPKSKTDAKMEQMFLDFGQKSFGQVACDGCGMVYFPGKEEDEREHAKYHKKSSQKSLEFKGWRNERVVKEFPSEGSRVVMVRKDDPSQHLAKACAIVGVMDKELGYVQSERSKEEERIFLYINGNKRAVGCVVVEPVAEAFPIIVKEEGESSSPPDPSAVVAADKSSEDSAVRCSKVPKPAVCGISRVWVDSSERRKGIATKLLDAVRASFIFGYSIPRDKCAFTQPTQDGRQFFAKYTNQEEFLVYNPKTDS